MNAETVEKNELLYYYLVNQGKENGNIIGFINPFVPQMYDHNFWYLKENDLSDNALLEAEKRMQKSGFFKFFGKIAETLAAAEWETPEYTGFTKIKECLVYMERSKQSQVPQIQAAADIREAVTDEDFQLYCDFNYEDGKAVSLSFAEEKLRLFYFLRELEVVRFYIAVVDEKVVGSLEVYQLSDYSKIENVYVEEAFRKRGIASGMIEKVIETNKKEGRDVALATELNGLAFPLYKRLGFNQAAFAVNCLFIKEEKDV